jgi:hypothetical protein
MIVPASKMLTAWALAISMPAEPEITPKLVIPPVKVRPAISIAVLLPARISLALSIRIPWLVATIVPLSTIAPRTMLPPRTATPVAAVILPLLRMLPAKVDTPAAAAPLPVPTAIPRPPALIAPLLVTPLVKVVVPRKSMPLCNAEIVPLLVVPPAKIEPPSTKIPLPVGTPFLTFSPLLRPGKASFRDFSNSTASRLSTSSAAPGRSAVAAWAGMSTVARCRSPQAPCWPARP